MSEPEEKTYDGNGRLIISELYRCQLFEKDSTAPNCCTDDCFFCKYSDFRKREYIEKVENEACRGILYSVCHNEKNNRKNID